MGRPPKKSLSFFKVFNKDKTSDELKIPSAYTLHMLGTLPHRVSLRDRYGNHWPVKLANIENELHFQQGWTKFVEDNSIETGDFIFFQYHDGKVFDFKLTGRNGSDKKGVGALKFKEKEEEHMEVEGVEGEKEESNDEEMDEDENQLPEKQVKSLNKKVAKAKAKDIHRGLRNFSKHPNFQEGAGAKCGKAKNPDHYGADIFKSGILPQPKNPYFVAKVKPKRWGKLYIPVDVIRNWSLDQLPPTATIRDSTGRTWSTNFRKWSDGRIFFIGGWASFCKENFIGDEDQCIYEFIKEGDQADLVIQIQVVRTSHNAMIPNRINK